MTVDNCIEGSMEMPGSPGNHSSFWSKAAGQYGLLMTLYYLLCEHQGGRLIMVACDGQLVLDQLWSNKSIDPFASHANLLSACHSIVTQLQCRVQFIHVKGHQDNGLPTVLLREVWLHIEVDLAAKIK